MHGNGGTKKFEFVSVCRSSVDETFTRKNFEFVFHVVRHKSSKRIRLSRILKCTDPGRRILASHFFEILLVNVDCCCLPVREFLIIGHSEISAL